MNWKRPGRKEKEQSILQEIELSFKEMKLMKAVNDKRELEGLMRIRWSQRKRQ